MLINSGSTASWRRWRCSATARKWTRKTALWGSFSSPSLLNYIRLESCVVLLLRWKGEKWGWFGEGWRYCSCLLCCYPGVSHCRGLPSHTQCLIHSSIWNGNAIHLPKVFYRPSPYHCSSAKCFVLTKTIKSLSKGARVGWKRSKGFESQKDFPAASSACHQVTSTVGN